MNAEQPVLVYFPQWQGSGLTDNVQIGARTLLNVFADVHFIEIPLSDEALTTKYNISGYKPLLIQLGTATTLLEKQQPDRVLVVMGDCGAEVAPITYLNERYKGELTVVWLDAHADLNTPNSSPSGHFHGMPLRLLLEGEFTNTAFQVDPPLQNRQVIFVGLRDTDDAEDHFIQERSLRVLTDTTFSIEKLEQLLVQQNAVNIYIHLDLDVLNPLQFPALQYPTTGGIEVEEIAQLVSYLTNNYNVVGMSLTETTATRNEDLRPIESILTEYKDWLSSSPHHA